MLRLDGESPMPPAIFAPVPVLHQVVSAQLYGARKCPRCCATIIQLEFGSRLHEMVCSWQNIQLGKLWTKSGFVLPKPMYPNSDTTSLKRKQGVAFWPQSGTLCKIRSYHWTSSSGQFLVPSIVNIDLVVGQGTLQRMARNRVIIKIR